MMHVKQAEISTDDFHLRSDGFIQTYKGVWKEPGMIASVRLSVKIAALECKVDKCGYQASSLMVNALRSEQLLPSHMRNCPEW